MRASDGPSAVIRARDLDTDDEVRTEVAAPDVASDDEVLRALTSLVGERFPDARQKSFAGEVASFVDPGHLIIARYVPGVRNPSGVRPERPVRVETQTSLFVD